LKNEERTRKYGKEQYEKWQQQIQIWNNNNPKQIKQYQHETSRKGGKYYEAHERYASSGVQHLRNLLRSSHRQHYRPYKQIIAPKSQIHHEWIPSTADYRGAALVEADQHMHGFVDVIQILEGKITLLTEEEVRSAS